MQQPKEDYQLQDFIDGRVEVPAREEKAPVAAKSPGIKTAPILIWPLALPS